MEGLLKDLYERKQFEKETAEFAWDLLNNKLDRKISAFNGFQLPQTPRKRAPGLRSSSSQSFEEQVKGFGTKVSEVPGFEDLKEKTNPSEIICWSLILFVLIGLTGYSFVHLIMDYLDNPTITNVQMQYSPFTYLPTATLCIPFHVDRIPFAGTTESDSFYPWKQTADLLGILVSRKQNLKNIFTCPSEGAAHEVEKKNVKVRLINEKGKKNRIYGRVEIALDGLWGTVCDTNWDNKDARVVCSMITGTYNENATTLHLIQGGVVPDVVWMDNVDCNGSEVNIGECAHSGWGETDCLDLNLAAVDCTGTADPDPWNGMPGKPKTKKIRDRDGSLSTKPFKVRLINEAGLVNGKWGAVEVAYHGIWGKISDELWGNNESKVICRMLGWEDDVGEAFNRPTFSKGHGPTWLTKVQCDGNESTIEDCSYEFTSRRHNFMAGVDCSGQADQEISLTREILSNFTFGQTAGALLARITAFETWNLVKGETPPSFKWSTSPTYPAGLTHKERAIKNLLTIMAMSDRTGDLNALKTMFKCSLCNTLNLAMFVQKDKYSTHKQQKVVDCNEASLTWIEDTVVSHRICFKIPLDQKPDMRKGSFIMTLDIGKLYGAVDWSNDTVRELYSNEFKLDFSGSLNAAKETTETVGLGPGEEQTITIDASANYIAAKDCNTDYANCELRCIAAEFQRSCTPSCIPFTWEKLLDQAYFEKPPYCMLEHYKNCFRHVQGVETIASQCSEQCEQPCQHMTYSVRTLLRKPLLGGKSQTILHIQLDSEVYPEFREESVISWYQLMGDLGGVIGLWLGASFVGVVHFLEFIVKDFCGEGRKKKKERIRNSITTMRRAQGIEDDL